MLNTFFVIVFLCIISVVDIVIIFYYSHLDINNVNLKKKLYELRASLNNFLKTIKLFIVLTLFFIIFDIIYGFIYDDFQRYLISVLMIGFLTFFLCIYFLMNKLKTIYISIK